MRADRLLSIMLLLQTRGLVPAAELAERLEVSVRTVYRDVEALSAAGVPVWAERGRHGGIRLLEGYRTDVTGLTEDEAKALFVLATCNAHDALGLGDAIGSARRKVMAALPAPHRPAAEQASERILVDPARWSKGPAVVAELGELQRAVFAECRLRLRYRHSGETDPREYTVDPYGLVNKAGVWYLVADLDGGPRLFRADRVLAAEQDGEPVRHRAGVGLAEAWGALRAQVERVRDDVRVTARVSVRQLDRFLRIHGSSLLGPPVAVAVAADAETDGRTAGEPAREPDGSGGWAEVELGYPDVRAARGLLAFGGSVEVTGPPEAREQLRLAAAEAVRLYGDG